MNEFRLEVLVETSYIMTVHVNVRNLSGSVISFKSKDTLPLEALKSLALASEAEAVPVGQQVLILGGDGRQIVGDQLNLKVLKLASLLMKYLTFKEIC